MHSIHFFIHFVQEHRYWGYALLFLILIFEGELTITAAGVLARIGAFHIFDALFFALLGVLTGDVLWYFLGRKIGEKFPQNRIARGIIRRVKQYLPGIEKNPFHFIFISKFIYGLNHSTIAVLGHLKTPFGHFIRIQLFASIIWLTIFFSLGYAFGGAALNFTHRLDKFFMFILIGLVVLVVVEKFLGRFIKKEGNAKL